MPGPPPKDANRRARRNATPTTTKLPSEGRKGRPPVWPLLPDVSIKARLDFAKDQSARARDEWAAETDGRKARGLGRKLEQLEVTVAELQQQLDNVTKLERTLWADLWKTPQAVMWERMAWTREVAQYVRWKVRAELGSLDASKEARMLSDRLGLSPLSMRNLRWEVVEDAVAKKREEQRQKKSPAKATGSRARRGPLRAV